MKKTILLLLITILCACESKPNEIHNPSDLATLALVLQVELRQENIQPVCSEEGLQEIEKFLENKPKAEQQKYVNKVGAYLGECMIQSYGGEWVENEPGVWAVKFSDGNLAFPIAKVQKFINEPMTDSFASMYALTPMVFKMSQEADSTK